MERGVVRAKGRSPGSFVLPGHRRRLRAVPALGLLLAIAAPASGSPRDSRAPLSFDERVAYQAAIEQVFYLHRIWPRENAGRKPPFEEVLPPALLRGKVEDYLRKSSALDVYGKRAVTAAQLQAEMDRMARDTRDPATLRELFAACDDDPYVIAECLARPSLVDRQIRSWYASTSVSFDTWWEEVRTRLPAAVDAGGGFTLPSLRAPSSTCTPDTWMPTSAPTSARADHVAVWTGTEMIVWGGSGGGALNSGGRYNPSTDTWVPTSTGPNVPSPRLDPTAVWTGTEVIVWGGGLGNAGLDTGGRYDPTTDTWRATSLVNAPAARLRHTAVWTGSEMIVWGGRDGSTHHDTGGRYDPVTDSWVATSTGPNAPTRRSSQSAVWTGSEMIVWGGDEVGAYLDTGGRYDPSTDAWSPTSTGAGAPAARGSHTAVWTGSLMIVWGGHGGTSLLDTGARYDPSIDAWVATGAGPDLPAARYMHTAVWTGVEMILWGGAGDDGGPRLDSGGRYDPATDTWRATSTGTGVPEGRTLHTTVWTGTEMIVWGGIDGSFFGSGGRYSPSTDTWLPTSTGAPTPSPRSSHTALWTGSEMLVWGGSEGPGASLLVNSGGRYTPATDTWTATSVGSNVPGPRREHSVVWTGREMIVWGGVDSSFEPLDTGGRYDPATDSWLPTSTEPPVPSSRRLQTAVWTGSEMIIWGGFSPSGWDTTGGRYDPGTDSWTATSTGTGVPTSRHGHTAAWTGIEMIVWGGSDRFDDYVNTGSRYDPGTDSWVATSSAVAPAGRSFHTAVWTGEEMIIWGGLCSSTTYCGTGGRYDPTTDTWSPTSTGSAAPIARAGHASAWTGREMIVWGGVDDGNDVLRSGGRYDPTTDAWASTSETAAPAARSGPTAVWTGNQMIVWGGEIRGFKLNSGGLYCADDVRRVDYVLGQGLGLGVVTG